MNYSKIDFGFNSGLSASYEVTKTLYDVEVSTDNNIVTFSGNNLDDNKPTVIECKLNGNDRWCVPSYELSDNTFVNKLLPVTTVKGIKSLSSYSDVINGKYTPVYKRVVV